MDVFTNPDNYIINLSENKKKLHTKRLETILLNLEHSQNSYDQFLEKKHIYSNVLFVSGCVVFTGLFITSFF